jgi:hypothetical protein
MTARAVWVLAMVLVIPGPILQSVIEWQGPGDVPFAVAFVGVQVCAACAGAVILSRHPRHAVGWVFLLLGFGLGLASASGAYAELALVEHPGELPAGEAAAWLSSWLFIPVIYGLPIVLLLVFPTGRLPSPRWRPVAWYVGGVLVFATAATAFKPDEIEPGIQNPLGAGQFFVTLDTISNALALPTMAIGVLAIVLRLRRARGVERQQLKWFSFAAAFVALGFGVSILVPGGWPADVAFLAGLYALCALPIATAVAILRYRLYDVDVVINRTLVYGGLTATLLASYLGLVLLLQAALSPLTEQSDVAIALSTLAVAALFRPLRARIQTLVDRRFYRQRYDAARTVEAFSGRLRDEVELESISAELRALVRDTMQPAHVSLWLRGAQR